MEIMSLKPTGLLLQLAPTTGLFLTDSGASCNAWNISHSVSFNKYQSVQHAKYKDSISDVKAGARINDYKRLAKMPNEAVMSSGCYT